MKRSELMLLEAKWQLAKNARITIADLPHLIRMIDGLFLLFKRILKEKEDSDDSNGTPDTRQ